MRTLYNLVAYSALTVVFRIALIFGGLTLLVYATGETACDERGNSICRVSASLGNPEASFFVATGYHSGERGYEVDIERALTEYRYAAEQDVPSAQYNLGEMLFSGDGVEQDLFEGLTGFLKATEAGEPRSMHRVAQLLFNTEEGPDDIELYADAAERGYEPSQFAPGMIRLFGIKSEEDEGEGLFWINEAYQAGYGLVEEFVEELKEQQKSGSFSVGS